MRKWDSSNKTAKISSGVRIFYNKQKKYKTQTLSSKEQSVQIMMGGEFFLKWEIISFVGQGNESDAERYSLLWRADTWMTFQSKFNNYKLKNYIECIINKYYRWNINL